MAYRQTSLRLPPDVRDWLRRRAFDLDATLTKVITDVVRGLIARESAAAEQLCAVCQTPRRLTDPDPLADVMAHAQCDQIVAKLEKSAS